MAAIGGRGASVLLALALAACGGGDDPAPAPGAPVVTTPSFEGVSGTTPFASNCHTDSATLYLSAEVEPVIAVNPANPANLIGVWQQDRWSNGGARGLLAAASTDGGATWTLVQAPFSRCSGGTAANGGDYEKATDPWISFGADGIAYWMSLSFSADPSAMLVSRSTDGGLTWAAPETLVLSTDPMLFHDKNSLTADPVVPGYAYAVWDRFNYDTFEAPALFARTTDGGVTWEAARAIHDPGPGGGTIANQIAVLPDGTLVNLLTQFDHVNDLAWLRVIRSTDQGATWSLPVTIAEVLLVGVYDAPTQAAVRGGGFVGAIAAGPTGMLYAAWQDGRFSGGEVDGIAFSMSANGGLTWTEPVQVNAVPTAAAFTPALAVAPDGTIAITYYDWRDNDAALTVPTSYWLATSPDGVSWTERQVGTPFDLAYAARSGSTTYFLGDYAGLAATAGEFLAFYGAANSSTVDRSNIRFEALPVSAPLAKRAHVAQPAPPVQMTPQWRARIAGQLDIARHRFPDNQAPPYLLRR